jgi:hypothetical protein
MWGVFFFLGHAKTYILRLIAFVTCIRIEQWTTVPTMFVLRFSGTFIINYTQSYGPYFKFAVSVIFVINKSAPTPPPPPTPTPKNYVFDLKIFLPIVNKRRLLFVM